MRKLEGNDEPARERIRTRLDETLFVEAGAGTGKTTALVTRIVELVATRTATLREIAAITFTEAAAAELRDRVRQRLEQAAVTDPCSERARACAEGAAHIDEAAILTLHGFAQRLLAAHPLDAGLPPDFEVADEVSSQLAFTARWAELVDTILADPALAEPLLDAHALGMRLAHLRDVARAFDRDYDRLEDPAVIPPPVTCGEQLDDLVAAIAAVCHCRAWCTDPGSLGGAPAITGGVPPNPPTDDLFAHLNGLARLSQRLGRAPNDRERLRLLADVTLKCSRGQKARWGGRAAEVRARLAELQKRGDALLAARRSAALVPLLERLRAATLDAAAGRAVEGRLEFHDLLVRACALLRDRPGARERLARRYRFVLIDEFQDTDPLQVEIALRLAGEGEGRTSAGAAGGRLFFVGDARQSIYRFRRADIATYQRTLERFRDGAVALSRNYRSVPSVIDWVNATFAPLLEGSAGQAAHQPLDGHRPPLDEAPAVRLLGEPVPGGAAQLRDRESAGIAAAIGEIRGRWPVSDQDGLRPARYDDIAILVPARTALPQLERALEDASIPFRVEARSLVYATQEVRELLAILRAVDDPTDQIAIVAALRSPALGCTDRDLVTWREAGGRWSYLAPPPVAGVAGVAGVGGVAGVAGVARHPVADGLARLAGLHERRWFQTPSGMVETVIREHRLLELACAHRRPREAWQRLRYVLDQARALTERAATLRQLCDWLQHQADEATRVTEQVLPDDDDEAVRILTVHGAKGLEFPVAILAGLASPRRGAPGPVILWDDEGHVQVRLRKGYETPGFAGAYARERQLDAQEEVRLLYVAATRARDHLIVGVHHRPTERGNGSLAERLWHQAQATPELWRPLNPPPSAPPTPSAVTTPPAPPSGEDREEYLAEREALIAANTAAPVVTAEALTNAAPDTQPGAVGAVGAQTPVGRAVRAVLRTVDLATDEGVDGLAAVQAAAERVSSQALRIGRLARSVLASHAIRAARDARRYWREVAVAGKVDEITVEGVVDLLCDGPEGLVMVQYVTDPVADDQLDAFVAGRALQTAACALALEAVLGRPVVACRLVFAREGLAAERAISDLTTAKTAVRAQLRERQPQHAPLAGRGLR